MIHRIVQFALQQRFLVLMLTVFESPLLVPGPSGKCRWTLIRTFRPR